MNGKEKLEPEEPKKSAHTFEELKEHSEDLRKRNVASQKKFGDLKQKTDDLLKPKIDDKP